MVCMMMLMMAGAGGWESSGHCYDYVFVLVVLLHYNQPALTRGAVLNLLTFNGSAIDAAAFVGALNWCCC